MSLQFCIHGVKFEDRSTKTLIHSSYFWTKICASKSKVKRVQILFQKL
uniref:Uncharacterized protein n=1 Tax=Arundo donax TaxID=35708 RepID=A0A0A9AWI2_ARUDO